MRNRVRAKIPLETAPYVKCKLYKPQIWHYGLAYEQIIQWDAPFNFVSHPATSLARLNVVSHPATAHAQLNVL